MDRLLDGLMRSIIARVRDPFCDRDLWIVILARRVWHRICPGWGPSPELGGVDEAASLPSMRPRLTNTGETSESAIRAS